MNSQGHYTVKTEHFEGPLDLLLSLIEEQKLDITRVSLAEIADAYLDYVKKQENISLGNLADFLSVAAKLILIKSKALLPLLQFDDEEEADMQELERQLAALRAIKDIIPQFSTTFQAAQSQYARGNFWGTKIQFTPDKTLTSDALEKGFRKSLSSIPKLDELEEKIIADVVSLEQKIVHVQKIIAERAEVIFSEVVTDEANKKEIIVSFLALLELVKQKIIVAKQEGTFHDILMKGQS